MNDLNRTTKFMLLARRQVVETGFINKQSFVRAASRHAIAGTWPNGADQLNEASVTRCSQNFTNCAREDGGCRYLGSVF